MFDTVGNQIRLTRGDSAYINLVVKNSEGEVREIDPSKEDIAVHVRRVKNPSDWEDNLIFEGKIEYSQSALNPETNCFKYATWHILPNDTKDVPVWKIIKNVPERIEYYWDAQLVTPMFCDSHYDSENQKIEYDVFTFIDSASFVLLDEVTLSKAKK